MTVRTDPAKMAERAMIASIHSIVCAPADTPGLIVILVCRLRQ